MQYPPHLREVRVTRYVTPLREGGSLPAIAEADDGFLYVLKFRGAGQGVKALIAECIGGEIARSLGLKVPEIVLAQPGRCIWPDRTRRRDPAAAQGKRGAEHRPALLVRLDQLRPRRQPGRPPDCFSDRLARLPAYQRRPHRAQHQYAHLEQGALADRPRRGFVFPPFLGRF